MTANNRDDYTRRNVLKTLGATGGAAVTAGLAGCLGGDDGSDPANSDGGSSNGGLIGDGPNLDISLGERPLRYVMSPAVLQDDGLIADQPADTQIAVPAGTTDYRRIQKAVTDKAWEKIGPHIYPPELFRFKYGSASVNPNEVNVVVDDVEAQLRGKSNERLVKTTIGVNELTASMEEHGFEQVRDRDGWTIYTGTYGSSEMQAAVNDGYVASIIDDIGEPVRGQTPNSIPPQNLDQFINTYIDFLNDGAPEAMALSDVNADARHAEEMYADRFDGRTWEEVAHLSYPDEPVYDMVAEDDRRFDFGAAFADFENQEQVIMNYHWFENGQERKTYWPSLNLETLRAESGDPEATYVENGGTG